MNTMSINDFKELMKNGMIENFITDGCLAPVVFFYSLVSPPQVMMIPGEFMQSTEGKESLANFIKMYCDQPSIIAGGIIMEAWGAKIHESDNISQQVLSGEIRVSELDNRQDIIVMIFSTPVGDEMIAYEVNPETHEVGKTFNDGTEGSMSGLFSGFFKWNRN